MSSLPEIGDLMALSGLTTLGADPAPDAVEGALRALAEKLVGADMLRRETARDSAVRLVRESGATADTARRLVDAALRGHQQEDEDGRQGRPIVLSDPDPWSDPVDGDDLLTELVKLYAKFVVLPEGGATAVALWTLHAHAHGAADISPVLAPSSAEKRCGKTTLLALLGALVPRPLPAVNVTAAALFRVVDAVRPTLLVDEADTFLRDREDLRGVLNAGHSRATAIVVRTIGDDHEVRTFHVWAPKAIALIGHLPDTLHDRAIEIRLRRRRPGDVVDRLRLDRLEQNTEPLRRKASRWAHDHLDVLRDADPEVPPELHDRASDNWRPLLAIADVAGGAWPERARHAARLLTGAAADNDDSAAVQLLADLSDLFATRATDRIPSGEIVNVLGEMEDRPWPEWKKGHPITARQLARILRPFDVKPKKIRFDDGPAQGYLLADLKDAFSRYVPPSDPEHPEHPHKHAENGRSAIRNAPGPVPDPETAGKPHHYRDVPDVPDGDPPARVTADLFAGLESER